MADPGPLTLFLSPRTSWDHCGVRRFVPWLLLGVLGLAAGLGVGFGVGDGPTEASVPTSSAEPGPSNLVPSWLPPGFAARSPGALTVRIDREDDRCAIYYLSYSPHGGPTSLPHGEPPRSYSTSNLTESVAYVISRCPLEPGVASGDVQVDGRPVTIANARYGALWASWKLQPRVFVVLAAVDVPRAEAVRFIAGLRLPKPSYLQHH